MAALKIYLDEDVHPFVAHALRLRGWEVLTTVEAGRRTTSDLDQLTFAADNGYAILTYDTRDFPACTPSGSRRERLTPASSWRRRTTRGGTSVPCSSS